MKISILKGDITKIKADAIVNAANYTLLGGGGVDGAIHRVAGPQLMMECSELRKNRFQSGLPTGQAVATKAYGLNAKIIIHTVGPRYSREDISLLQECYMNSLRIAEEQGCKSIAFPAIATGAYGVPIEKSAEIVKEVLQDFTSEVIEEVVLVLFKEEDVIAYNRVVLGNKEEIDRTI